MYCDNNIVIGCLTVCDCIMAIYLLIIISYFYFNACVAVTASDVLMAPQKISAAGLFRATRTIISTSKAQAE